MSENKKKIITVIGSESEIGKKLIHNLKNKHKVLSISNKNSKNKYTHINLTASLVKQKIKFENLKLKKNFFSSSCIVFLIGKFEKTKSNYSEILYESNFKVNFNILKFLSDNKKKFSHPCKCIILNSMNSIIPNKKSAIYATSKSALTTAVQHFKQQWKNTNLSIENIMAGPIKTKMRQNNKDSLDKKEILKLINFLISADKNTTFGNIEIFHKRNFFKIY